MSRSRCSRLLSLLAVLSLLSSPLLAFGGRARPEQAPDIARTFWQFLSSLLPTVDKAQGTMDPNGSANAETSSVDSDARGTMDPDGRF